MTVQQQSNTVKLKEAEVLPSFTKVNYLTYTSTTPLVQLVRWFWPLCHPLITDNEHLIGYRHIIYACLHFLFLSHH